MYSIYNHGMVQPHQIIMCIPENAKTKIKEMLTSVTNITKSNLAHQIFMDEI